MMQRALRILCCTLCFPLLSGCVLPFCVYPTVGYTPSVATGAPSDEVHAFRVDFTNHYAWTPADEKSKRGEIDSRKRLSLLPISSAAEVAAQVKPAVTYGIIFFGGDIPGTGLLHSSKTVGLRLYRPGFELIEIKSWGRAGKIDWRSAGGLEGQERVLDMLFPVDGNTFGREAFLFGASEYDRLSAEALSDDDRMRLDVKAKVLRAQPWESDVADNHEALARPSDGWPRMSPFENTSPPGRFEPKFQLRRQDGYNRGIAHRAVCWPFCPQPLFRKETKMAVSQPAPVVPTLIHCPACRQNGTAFKPLFRFEPGVPPLIHPQAAAIRFVVCNYCNAVIAGVA